jgi:hypothetical protein
MHYSPGRLLPLRDRCVSRGLPDARMPYRPVPEETVTGHVRADSANGGGTATRLLTGALRRSILLVATSATAAVLAVGFCQPYGHPNDSA